jgi:hypothetical protein
MKVEKFKNIFDGLDRAHGFYEYTQTKQNGKRDGRMRTVHEEPTLQMFQDHLEGKDRALGIVPIRDDATCTWGCIDIDEYPLDHKKILSQIRKYKLPLVMCASKSFGAHLFLFSKNPQPAFLFDEKLKEIRAHLGYAKAEVFPKQIKLSDEQDTGSWLNLPYHGETRYAFLDNGEGATLEEFFELYDKFVCDDIGKILIQVEDNNMADGPPCLEILTDQGYPEGTRNNGLFNVGVFYRKSNPDDWKNLLETYNREYMEPPLNTNEVGIIMKQVGADKADGAMKYMYKCNDQPIASVCQKAKCKLRKFGVGTSGQDHPVYANLRVTDREPRIWYLDIDSHPVETQVQDEIEYHHRLRKLVKRKLLRYIPMMKQADWEEIQSGLFETITTINMPEDVSKVGEFKDYLFEFCTARGESFDIDELDMEKPYTNVEENATYFRLRDLSKWLENTKNFKENRSWLVQRIKDLDGEDVRVYPKGIQTRAWKIPAYTQPKKMEKMPNLKTEEKTDKDILGKSDDEEITF